MQRMKTYLLIGSILLSIFAFGTLFCLHVDFSAHRVISLFLLMIQAFLCWVMYFYECKADEQV